ncbi:hypothetical protein FEMY_23700 [Ferrovum myxofaciens]|uniref:Uncharacterized protein n=1 Tax=Ferrovum myxofaciens TaxID=416213 RepID=A0A149VW16_9PROT|nr:hypothetical protein [Ferrovum myxofaciens]KXW57114.1 hypothetical protein FEMY_23700 [Ferrovum myxofaciens]
MNIRLLISALTVLTLTGCAGSVDYVQPNLDKKVSNEKIINLSRDQVWNSTIPALSKKFFVINNLDKSSGLINISYSGDPEKYIDCGQISSHLPNIHGDRIDTFPAAISNKRLQVMVNGHLINEVRKVELNGKVSLSFEELSPSKTKVTVNTHYIVRRQITFYSPSSGVPISNTDTIEFNSDSLASFPAVNDGRATECVGTGLLENEILNAIN